MNKPHAHIYSATLPDVYIKSLTAFGGQRRELGQAFVC